MSLLLTQLGGGAGVTGTGALTAQAATVTGTGISSSTGTGELSAGASTASGVGLSSSTGTGALSAQASTIAGTGTVVDDTIIGTGVLLAQDATASGAGISSSTGTGTLTADAATIAGVGASSSAGTGALTDQDSTLSGVGIAQWVARDGSFLLENGVDHYLLEDGGLYLREEIHLEAQPSTVSGAGISSATGTGALFSGASTVSGVGIVPEQAVGSGPGVGVRPGIRPGVDDYYSAIPLLKRKIRKEQEEEEAREIAAAAQQVAFDIAAERAQETAREPLDYSKVATPTTDLAAFAKIRTEAKAEQARLAQEQDDEDAIIAILMAA